MHTMESEADYERVFRVVYGRFAFNIRKLKPDRKWDERRRRKPESGATVGVIGSDSIAIREQTLLLAAQAWSLLCKQENICCDSGWSDEKRVMAKKLTNAREHKKRLHWWPHGDIWTMINAALTPKRCELARGKYKIKSSSWPWAVPSCFTYLRVSLSSSFSVPKSAVTTSYREASFRLLVRFLTANDSSSQRTFLSVPRSRWDRDDDVMIANISISHKQAEGDVTN